jgi:hypothetical protein
MLKRGRWSFCISSSSINFLLLSSCFSNQGPHKHLGKIQNHKGNISFCSAGGRGRRFWYFFQNKNQRDTKTCWWNPHKDQLDKHNSLLLFMKFILFYRQENPLKKSERKKRGKTKFPFVPFFSFSRSDTFQRRLTNFQVNRVFRGDL